MPLDTTLYTLSTVLRRGREITESTQLLAPHPLSREGQESDCGDRLLVYFEHWLLLIFQAYHANAADFCFVHWLNSFVLIVTRSGKRYNSAQKFVFSKQKHILCCLQRCRSRFRIVFLTVVTRVNARRPQYTLFCEILR